MSEEKVISRSQAAALGLHKYRTAKSCIHNHKPYRYTANGICCECAAVMRDRYRAKLKAALKAANQAKEEVKDVE